MEEKQFAVWLGQNSADLASGFVVEDGFYCVLEIKREEAENELRQITEAVRQTILNSLINNPKDLKEMSDEIIKKHKLTSFAAIHVSNEQIITYAERGQIILLRGKNAFRVSTDNKALSGNYQDTDSYLLVGASVRDKLTPHFLTELKEIAHPKELVNIVKKEFDDSSGVLLAVQTPAPPQVETPIFFPASSPSLKPGFSPKQIFADKRIRLVVIGLVLVLIVIKAVTLVGAAIEKQKEKSFNQELRKLEANYQKLAQDLQTNPTRAIKNIDGLQAAIVKLKNRNTKFALSTEPLRLKISKLEQTYGNAQVAKDKLFYDLALINKKAQGDYLGVTENYLTILDNQNKVSYLINIENKDHEDFPYPKIKEATLSTEYDGEVFLYAKGAGIFETSEGKFNKVVSAAKNWGTAKDMKVFNSNIYLLDSDRDEIFKFTPVNDGYSSQISYFQSGQSQDLKNAKSMAIDFSVYILGSSLSKYTAGSVADFSPNTSLDYSQIQAVYKTGANNYLYLLDSKNSRVIVLNENGRLIRSIFNSKLGQARYFGVYKDEKIIFMHQDKLYELDKF